MIWLLQPHELLGLPVTCLVQQKKCWSWLQQLQSISYGFIGILYNSRLILLCSSHLDKYTGTYLFVPEIRNFFVPGTTHLWVAPNQESWLESSVGSFIKVQNCRYRPPPQGSSMSLTSDLILNMHARFGTLFYIFFQCKQSSWISKRYTNNASPIHNFDLTNWSSHAILWSFQSRLYSLYSIHPRSQS